MKKLEKSDTLYVLHILEAIDKVEGYLGDVTYDDFFKNNLLIDGVARELGIIGEAANNLSIPFREKYPEIPYAPMIAMRNYLIHEYFGVDNETVWRTCKESLPELKKILLPLRPGQNL